MKSNDCIGHVERQLPTGFYFGSGRLKILDSEVNPFIPALRPVATQQKRAVNYRLNKLQVIYVRLSLPNASLMGKLTDSLGLDAGQFTHHCFEFVPLVFFSLIPQR